MTGRRPQVRVAGAETLAWRLLPRMHVIGTARVGPGSGSIGGYGSGGNTLAAGADPVA